MVNKNEKITMQGKELLKPKNDIIFQTLFNQKNERITKNMISVLLEENITSIKINDNKELFREYPEDKLGILDLEAEINDKEKIDIEIQLVDRKNLAERMLRYFSKLYTIQKGENYKDLKRVVLIAIIDYKFDLTKEIKQMETIWNLREKNNPKLILTDNIEIHIIELNKALYEYNKDKNNAKAQWMMFINNPNDKEVFEIMKENEEIKEARKEVEKMSEDEKIRRLAWLREKAILDETAIYDAGIDKGIERGKIEGKREGIKEGIGQGVKLEKINTAKKLLKINMPIDKIIEITKLTKEEVEKIKL